jgi:hypothetical protein
LQALQENVGGALFEAGVGEVGQRLSGDRENFLLRAATDRLAQVLRDVAECLGSLRTQGVSGFACFVEESLAFGFGFDSCFG